MQSSADNSSHCHSPWSFQQHGFRDECRAKCCAPPCGSTGEIKACGGDSDLPPDSQVYVLQHNTRRLTAAFGAHAAPAVWGQLQNCQSENSLQRPVDIPCQFSQSSFETFFVYCGQNLPSRHPPCHSKAPEMRVSLRIAGCTLHRVTQRAAAIKSIRGGVHCGAYGGLHPENTPH